MMRAAVQLRTPFYFSSNNCQACGSNLRSRADHSCHNCNMAAREAEVRREAPQSYMPAIDARHFEKRLQQELQEVWECAS